MAKARKDQEEAALMAKVQNDSEAKLPEKDIENEEKRKVGDENTSSRQRIVEDATALANSASSPPSALDFQALENALLTAIETDSSLSSGGKMQLEFVARLSNVEVNSIKQAADTGVIPAIGLLGGLHHLWSGSEHDDSQAVICLNKAAEKGDVFSMIILGSLYHLGTGVPQDEGRAVIHYRNAAEKGNMFAMLVTAVVYANGGTNLPKDLSVALTWAEKAQVAGHPHAVEVIAAIRQNKYFQQQRNRAMEQLRPTNQQTALKSMPESKETHKTEPNSSNQPYSSNDVKEPPYIVYNKRSIDINLRNGVVSLRKGTPFKTYARISGIGDGYVTVVPTWVDANRIDANKAYPRRYVDQKFDPSIQDEIPNGIELPGMYFSSDESFRAQ